MSCRGASVGRFLYRSMSNGNPNWRHLAALAVLTSTLSACPANPDQDGGVGVDTATIDAGSADAAAADGAVGDAAHGTDGGQTDTATALCTTDRDCADGLFCTGVERCQPEAAGADSRGCVAPANGPCGAVVCDEASRSCEVCPPVGSTGTCDVGSGCDDGTFCNGDEVCLAGYCQRTPRSCDQGLTCVESARACGEPCLTASDCQDASFCNGAEICDRGICGLPTALPCESLSACSESLHRCTRCASFDDCQDGNFCNGAEYCILVGGLGGSCHSAVVPRCSDTQTCDEAAQTCRCGIDSDCDDGFFCNGVEHCLAHVCYPGVSPCAMSGDSCDEGTWTCSCGVNAGCDDGWYCNGIEQCSGGNCYAGIAPCVAPRTCDETGRTCTWATCVVDQDCADPFFCNGVERCMPGASGADVHGCVASSTSPCVQYQRCDEGQQRCVFYCPHAADADGDGHVSIDCGGDDCDDTDEHRFPGNPELCPNGLDLRDEDCDPLTVGSTDADNDGFVSSGCCNVQRDLSQLCGPDCDDSRADISPVAAEICDGIDNNCNGQIDEGVLVTGYLDSDGDGSGTAACARQVCPGAAGYTANHNDCNDGDALVLPGGQQCGSGNSATEIWICGSGGLWTQSHCGSSQVCVVQPSGAGTCQ